VKKIILIFCITLIGIGLADTTKADVTEGNWIVRSGYTFLVPQLSNESLIEIEKYSMPTLSFSYLVTDNLAIEFLAGIPTSIDVNERSTGTGSKLATFTPIAPNATLQYYFKPKDARFRPYIGAGLLYSTFHKEKAYGILEGATFRIDKSLDHLYQIGFDYAMNEKISLNLDVRKLKTSSSALATDLDRTIMGNNAPPQMRFAMDMQPVTVSLNVAWLFDSPKRANQRRLKNKEILEAMKQRREKLKLEKKHL